jgi:5'-AMP-activated protein kinase regulatory beta subunit
LRFDILGKISKIFETEVKNMTKKTTKEKTTTCKAKACCAKKTVAKKAVKPAAKSVKFTVRADAGKKVCIAGCFNKWDAEKTPMKYVKKDGVYSVTVKLAPGTYEYKFVVDGVWQADPECADFVQNDCGTLNSVITVK